MFPFLLIVAALAVLARRAPAEQGGAVANAKPVLAPIDVPHAVNPFALGAPVPASSDGKPVHLGAPSERDTAAPGLGPIGTEQTRALLIGDDANAALGDVFLDTQRNAIASYSRLVDDESVTHLGGDVIL